MQERKTRSNVERTEATRAALIEAARKLFVEKSYAETGTPEIVAAAGVTRGALYHHFADKQALFLAVVEQESARVAEEIEKASAGSLSPREELVAGGAAFLDAMAKDGRTRLLLLDGPAILGRAIMDEIDGRHGNCTLREGLVAAMRAGAIKKLPVEPLTALLAAAFDRTALSVEAGGDRGAYEEVLAALVDGLAPVG